MPFLCISKNKCRRRFFLYFTLVAVFADYSPQTYPNGLNSPQECGTLTPSLLCDPANLLNDGSIYANHAELIQKLDQIRVDSKCLCEDTDIGSCVDGNGTKISLAIVPRMQRNDSIRLDGDGRRRVVREFAEDLRKRQSRGQCDDDVLIVYSQDDHELCVSTGAVSGRVITPEVINEIEVIAALHCHRECFGDSTHQGTYRKCNENCKVSERSDSPVSAIMTMVERYHQVLDGNTPSNLRWWEPYLRYIIIAICVVVFGTAFALVGSYLCCKTAVLRCLCCKTQYRSVHGSDPETGTQLEELKGGKQ